MKLKLCKSIQKERYFIMDCTTSIPRRSQREKSLGLLFKLCLSGSVSIREYAVDFAAEDNAAVRLSSGDYLAIAEADSLEELKLSVPWVFL